MSNRSPYSILNSACSRSVNCSSVPSSGNSVYNMNQNSANHNNLVPRAYTITNPRQEFYLPNNFHNNEYTCTKKPSNISLPCTSTVNNFNRMPISASPPARFFIPVRQYYPSQPIRHLVEQNYNVNPIINQLERNSDITVNGYQTGFPYPAQNVNCSNLPGFISNDGYPNNVCHIPTIPGSNVSKTYSSCTEVAMSAARNSNNMTSLSVSGNNSVTFSGNTEISQTVPPTLINSANFLLPQVQNNCTFHAQPPILTSDTSHKSLSSNQLNASKCKKEMELCEFLSRFSLRNERKGSQITVPEFRSLLKAAFSLMKVLTESKYKLSNLMEVGETEWNSELENISNLKKQLSEICSLISAPVHLNAVMKKLKFIKRKRELKKKAKLNQLSQRIKVEQNRKDRHLEIDKYLDDIKEKDLKFKREAEMKKEADFILLEVRKKIHEAKRTIEKIKVFEKLRNARQVNATQKGLHILSVHNEKFEKKITCMKETILKQLADYEAEEKALKVMLETEQEGQLEEESQWKLKKAKTLQQKKQNHIKECLFGSSEDPVPTDPLFLFHQYHTSANNSIENLVQIRHHWDAHIAEDGEAVPQQWVAPVVPSNSSWEQWLTTSVSKN